MSNQAYEDAIELITMARDDLDQMVSKLVEVSKVIRSSSLSFEEVEAINRCLRALWERVGFREYHTEQTLRGERL